jgi:sporadic carbohydrate cluster 2OG-Fe(II) oxygenase
MSLTKNFEKKGFVIIDMDPRYLEKFEYIRQILTIETKKNIYFKKNFSLEKFHNYKLKNISLNQFRNNLISKINNQKNFKSDIYESLSSLLDSCLGPDIIVQKNINLVIQKPFDKDRAPFHKDAPINSNYEIVVWIPLVDCFNTMSMYIFDIKKHKKNEEFIKKNYTTKSYEIFSRKEGYLPKVKFGQALVFWSNNYHYIPINKEKATRWSLNVRYKNLFTKYGTKNLLDFYDILKTSAVTKLLDRIDV